jgi:hypothetical protein
MDTTDNTGTDYQKLLNTEMTEDDMKKLLRSFGNVNILAYPDLAGKTIDDVFGPCEVCVLLFLTDPKNKNEGHWVGLMKHGSGMIEHFDSYGLGPDREMSWLDRSALASLKESRPLLHDLLRSFPGRVIHNTTKLQRDVSGISTCGRHVACRLLHKDIPIRKYASDLLYSGDPDRTVVDFTESILRG